MAWMEGGWRVGGWMDGWVDGRLVGWVGWVMDGWMDGRVDSRLVEGWRREQSCCSDCSMVRFPGIRPTAEVVAILNKTPRRAQVVGILRAEGLGDVLRLTPCDPRMPHMMVNASSMPAEMQQRLLVRPPLFALCSGKLCTLQSLIIDTWSGQQYMVHCCSCCCWSLAVSHSKWFTAVHYCNSVI